MPNKVKTRFHLGTRYAHIHYTYDRTDRDDARGTSIRLRLSQNVSSANAKPRLRGKR